MNNFVEELSEIQYTVHQMAKEKGWWDNPETNPLEKHMLMVSELAEATEEARKGTPPVYYVLRNDRYTPEQVHKMLTDLGTPSDDINGFKPEGELIELADTVIRILDYCGHKGWKLGEAIERKIAYNATRAHRHGGKKF